MIALLYDFGGQSREVVAELHVNESRVSRIKQRANREASFGHCGRGYSMPETDIEIRHLLKSAQLARTGPAELSIDVVLQNDKSAATRYRRFFDSSNVRISQEGLEQLIEADLPGMLRFN